ncbi:RUN domain-containing protein 1 isoform X1 [Drosophila nasuta]|uniref:RUN domain-containing protein 1 isoform X1 n=1 Tax=Drosophila nasuta TaxID=42062 RepID=UPI00295E479B|nr:RUN domain-containing protein 1 isoform X1 [Drosophila nasuta]
MEMDATQVEGRQQAASHNNSNNTNSSDNNDDEVQQTTATTTTTIEHRDSIDSPAFSGTEPDPDPDVEVDIEADAEDEAQPLSERWSPLGANYDDANSVSLELLSGIDCGDLEPTLLGLDKLEKHQQQQQQQELQQQQQPTTVAVDNASELARLRSIEDEQELLTSSLLALTSQFAHVQLRVRQIVEAPTDERDQLLRDLEDFAFQGIPETVQPLAGNNKNDDDVRDDDDDGADNKEAQGEGEVTAPPDGQLIEQLKSQLTELEQLAYESGAPGVLPQHVLLEKQKFILDELRTKLNLQVEQHQLPGLSTEQLRHQVDNAIGEFVGPLKMKEQLVAQLKTQITDLERFIAFLQCDTAGSGAGSGVSSASDKLKLLSGAYNSYAAKQTARQAPKTTTGAGAGTKVEAGAGSGAGTVTAGHSQLQTQPVAMEAGAPRRESLHSKAHGLLDKASLLMQMFATTHFAKRQADFQQNSLKKTHKGNHWGDLRAQLEVDIQEVAALAATLSCDREKLANIKRALRQQQQQHSAGGGSLALNAQNGALTTVPPRCRRAAAAAVAGHELTPYAAGAAGAAASSDSDEDAYERYDWDKDKAGLGRRIVHMRGDSIATIGRELTSVVRKNFARTLQQLIQHGLRIPAESAASSLMVPFMRCLQPGAQRVSATTAAGGGGGGVGGGGGGLGGGVASSDMQFLGIGRSMHVWELIIEYYNLKNGEEYNNTPARKLSQSFQLDIVDAHAVTAKQSLLSAIGMILAMHRPYKRSYNAHFKALICAGLNAHLLVEWLNLILSCNELIDTYYTSNSYVACTGFRDSLRSIDALSKFDFDLPVDLAIRHFRNI